MKTLVALFLTTSLATAAPQGGLGNLNALHLGQSLLVASPFTMPPQDVPGVFGKLRINPGSAIVVPFDENQLSVVDFLEGLGPVASTFHFQMLRNDEQGYHLSTLRRIGEDSELRFTAQQTMQQCRARALQCIAQTANTEMAEGWQGQPLITGQTPLFRPDVQGPAYIEFAVDQGGFVIAATGDHDMPIPNWSSVGIAPTQRLRQQVPNQTIARFYKIDTMTLVGENANGQRIATQGEMPNQLLDVPAIVDDTTPDFEPLLRAWPSWRAMKLGFSESYRPYLRRFHAEARDRWQVDNDPGDSSWSAWTTYTADGSSSEQPEYDQFTYGSCLVGCGPVAWAILFAWGDRQAHAGNAYWSARTGLYRTNGGTTAGGASSSAVAPIAQDGGIDNIIEEIHEWVDTYCLFGSGATWPSDMDEAQGYLDARTGAYCTGTDSNTFIATSSKREDARNSIRDRDTPVVIGTSMGGGLHYPVAFKYRWRSKDNWLLGTQYDREFYVNPGWGSDSLFQWVDAKTWFVGQLYP